MNNVIPTNTEVKLRGKPMLFKVTSVITAADVHKYQLVSVRDNSRHTQDVTSDDLIVVNDRELYKKVIVDGIRNKKKLIKSIAQEIKVRKDTLTALEKFSSDETEVVDIIDTFKDMKPAAICTLLTSKEHINFTKFLDEWM